MERNMLTVNLMKKPGDGRLHLVDSAQIKHIRLK